MAVPPAFFLWIEFAALADSALGLPLHGTVQIPAILADAALAGLVYQWLGWRGANERLRLLAGGLVALGPSFAAVSGYHGHIDSLAILPAVAALIVWQRSDASTRALTAGALIGVGAAIKTVPLLALLALLPYPEDRGTNYAVRNADYAVETLLSTLSPATT